MTDAEELKAVKRGIERLVRIMTIESVSTYDKAKAEQELAVMMKFNEIQQTHVLVRIANTLEEMLILQQKSS